MPAYLSLLALLLISADAPSPPGDLGERCRILRDEGEARRAAKTPPWQLFRDVAPRFLEIAKEAPRDPAALDALIISGQYGSVCLDTCLYDDKSHLDLMARTLDAIDGRFLEDERVGRLCLTLSRLPSPAREAFLRRVVRESENASVRGCARLALAELLKTKQGCVEGLAGPVPPEVASKLEMTWGRDYLAHLRSSDAKAIQAEAEGLLERIIDDRDATLFVRGTSDTSSWRPTAEKDIAAAKTLAMVAETDLDEIRNLAPGRVAPEIEGRDAEGVPFKLSDHRGKVVVLTFSGNWCGPCRSMYPYERELARRLESKPFALLSVNTDRSVDTLRKSIREGEVTWRCWWDGEPGGPIASRWNIRVWPTVYVLDARGVIRAKNPPDESLDGLIDDLLKEGSDGERTAPSPRH